MRSVFFVFCCCFCLFVCWFVPGWLSLFLILNSRSFLLGSGLLNSRWQEHIRYSPSLSTLLYSVQNATHLTLNVWLECCGSVSCLRWWCYLPAFDVSQSQLPLNNNVTVFQCNFQPSVVGSCELVSSVFPPGNRETGHKTKPKQQQDRKTTQKAKKKKKKKVEIQ